MRMRESEIDTRQPIYEEVKMESIEGFRGDYYFLSNFYPCTITFCALQFQSAEAAFQAAKCREPCQRRQFCNLSAADAKRLGRQIALREDWEQCKVSVMKNILLHKFKENQELRERLLETGMRPLVEVNTWHDNFWGSCTCGRCRKIQDQNILGRLLMEIRSFYSKDDSPVERNKDVSETCNGD